MNEQSLAQKARAVERDIFGMLIGSLLGVILARLLLIVADINEFVLGTLLLIGAWSGGFVAHLASNRSAAAIDSLRSLSARFRSVGLRFVLWMLGAAAVLGVLSVLTGSYEVVGRVAATALVTGLAAGFLFPLLALLDEGNKWRVGLLGTASVFAAYFLGLPSIWELGYRPNESAISGLVIVLMMPVGLVAMQLSHDDHTRAAGWFAAILYFIALIPFLCAIWDERWNSQEQFLCLLAPLRGGQIWWRAVTIAAAAITAIALDAEVWINDGRGQISFVGRVAIAAAIVTSTGTPALLIFTRLNHSSRAVAVPKHTGAMTQITLYCPNCGKQQTIPLVQSTKCDCGVEIQVHVDDTRIG